MLFSCKISNSALTYLENQNQSLERLYERTTLPLNLLRDSSSWLNANEMESFLATLESEFSTIGSQDDLMKEIGHTSAELKAWGPLNSVLKLLQDPWDVYRQPQRLLSYFISPTPPIAELDLMDQKISFSAPIFSEQFPLVTGFLSAAFEALPSFTGKPPAHVEWTSNRIIIEWSNPQTTFFDNQETFVRPTLVQNLVHTVESSQQELEKATQELMLKNEELKRAKKALRNQNKQIQNQDRWDNLVNQLQPPVGSAINNLWRMRDYLTRYQQLITLLIGQGRMTSQVQEAMRRVDWQLIRDECPKVIDQTAESLELIQQLTKENRGHPLERSNPEIGGV